MEVFEWEDKKVRTNLSKCGVSFTKASTVFNDLFARVVDDQEHSIDEERFVVLGMSFKARELVVCHCLRGTNHQVVRIISARRATKSETAQYWRYINAGRI